MPSFFDYILFIKKIIKYNVIGIYKNKDHFTKSLIKITIKGEIYSKLLLQLCQYRLSHSPTCILHTNLRRVQNMCNKVNSILRSKHI